MVTRGRLVCAANSKVIGAVDLETPQASVERCLPQPSEAPEADAATPTAKANNNPVNVKLVVLFRIGCSREELQPSPIQGRPVNRLVGEETSLKRLS
jgi:hypothetical protein